VRLRIEKWGPKLMIECQVGEGGGIARKWKMENEE